MYQRILVPVDGSPTSEAGLAEAIKLGKATGATLRLLHVVDLMPYGTGLDFGAGYAADLVPALREAGQAILKAAGAKVEAAGLKLQTQLVESLGDRASELIVAELKSSGSDLVVIGTHGRRGIPRLFLGSDAEQVLRLSTVPVLLVRAAHERSGA